MHATGDNNTKNMSNGNYGHIGEDFMNLLPKFIALLMMMCFFMLILRTWVGSKL